MAPDRTIRGSHSTPALAGVALRTALALLAAGTLAAQDLELRQTRDLNLVFSGQAFLADHAVRCFENSMAFHRKLFGYRPSEPVTVFLEDWGDFGYGGTMTVPWNYVHLSIEPFDYVFDTCPANERINWLMHHELTHVVATDKASASDQRYRRWLGGKVEPSQASPLTMAYSYLTSPRWYAPRWYEEGIAVFLETWMSGGAGRVLGGYDEMVFRTRVLENARFFNPLGVETVGKNIDFNGGQTSYLYGTRFVSYLALTCGPDKLIAWFNRTDDSARYFSTQFRRVFGLSLEDAWARWIAFEKDWQGKNLALIRQYPLTRATPLGTPALGSLSRTWYDARRNCIYAASVRPATAPQLVAIDAATGAVRPLAKVKGAAYYFVCSLAFDPVQDKLFFTTRNAGGWRDLNELDLKTGRTRLLIKGARTGDLVVHPGDQAIWGIQHRGGYSHLVRIPKPYRQVEPLITLDYGRELVDIDMAPDGRSLCATQIEVTGATRLVRIDVDDALAGRGLTQALHSFESCAPANFVFSPDGRYLYGSSYYSGASNLYRYDLEQARMEALSNVETGLFRPLPTENGLVAYQYASDGFKPVWVDGIPVEDVNAIQFLGQEVVEKHPELKAWNAGSPARVDVAQVVTHKGIYHLWDQTRFASLYPVVEGYRNKAAVGLRANFSDPLEWNQVDFTATYSTGPRAERLHLKLDLLRAPWKVVLKNNSSDFYDLFGPTRISRKGQSALVSYHDYLVYDKPEILDYTVTAAGYQGIDTLPDSQNVGVAFTRYATFGAHLDFRNVVKTLGGVEPERGLAWTLGASASRVSGTTLSQGYGTFDIGELVPGLDHSSLWLRTAAGGSGGDQHNPLASFYFGGFGNNWVDWQEVNRYRQYGSLPGLELDQVNGRSFAKATVEWTLPPIRVERAGAAGFYLDYARFALFQSWLETDPTDALRRQGVPSTGVQVDCALKLFSNLNATLSFGYASARYQGRTGREAMVSLKLLDY